MRLSEDVCAGGFIALLLLGSVISLGLPAGAALTPKAPAWTPPPLPAPLAEVARSCRATLVERDLLFDAAGDAETAAGPQCACVAKRLGDRFQDTRSAAYAARRLDALAASQAARRPIPRLFRRARDEARALGMTADHQRAVAAALDAAIAACPAGAR